MAGSSIYEEGVYDSALAIVGMAGRFPGAQDVQSFWRNLAQGITSIRALSDEELRAAGVDSAVLAQPNYVKAASTLDGLDQFDASFFGYTPREAETMDPQHRLFLESAWQALEQAGYDPYSYRGLIGVFAGSAFSSYLELNLHPYHSLKESVGQLQLDVGNDRDSLASMVSYKLNLRGPAVAVQTFCSTSLVAVHLACQSLLNYECDVALAGGVSIQIPHGQGYFYEEGSILSPDGVCRSFDARARGSVMGSGVGVVTLKRFREALEQGDRIYALVRGSAINNDGSLRVSYTAPGLEGQANVIQAALSYAQVPAESISYIEAHGTATKLGDAVELAAMRKVFEGQTQRQFCALGSVKANVGHLDRASGVTGLIKTSLALWRRELPPSVHYEQPNAELEGEQSPFFVNTQLRAWPEGETPRRAGVSSFGLGGTNAHVVLEEAPRRESTPGADEGTPQLLVLSGRTESALRRMEERLAEHLRGEEGQDEALGDVAYTLQVGRANFGYRRMLVCRTKAEGIAQLERGAQAGERGQVERRDRAVAFMLGDGASWSVSEIQELCGQQEAYRQEVERCCDLLRLRTGLDLRAFLFSRHAQEQPSETLTRLADFVSQYALARTFMRSGIQPCALYGSGRGEYVAACLAGIFSLEDGLELVAADHGQRAEKFQHMALHAPEMPYISALTETWSSAEQVTEPAYWLQPRSTDAAPANQACRLLRENGAALLCIGSSDDGDATEVEDGISLAVSGEGSALETVLRALGRLWLSGVAIDWSAFQAAEQRQRVPLPTYPFEKQRYWIDSPEERITKQRAIESEVAKKTDPGDWFYQPHWTPQPLATGISVAPRSVSWLIFSDESGLGARLAESLTAAGYGVIQVSAGTQYTHVNEHQYVIRPAERVDYDILCQELLKAGRLPQRIIHCWSVDTEQVPFDFERAQERGFYSLLWLAQALGKHLIEETVHIDVISSQMQMLPGDRGLVPEKATMLGVCKVIPQEYLNITCRSIDIDQVAHPVLIDSLLSELNALSEGIPETVVAYRDAVRWVQGYQATPLVQGQGLPHHLRARGTYLITGGLGNVGLALAEYLVNTLQARLVLVGRSAFPPRSSWEDWIAQHSPTDAVSQKIQRLLALEAQGPEVLVIQADVADGEQLEAAFMQAERRFGQIHGVIHAAGITNEEDFKTLLYLERVDCEVHFRPKVYGLQALEQAVRGRGLDFCLLFSSLSTVLGGLSLAAYTAANAFMEAFVQQHSRGVGTQWISVAWDTWQFKQESSSSPGATVTQYGMSVSEGVAAFARVLGSEGINHLVHSTGDLAARIRQWVLLEGLRQGSGRETTTSLPVSGQRNDYERLLTQIWQDVLGLKEVGLYENFFDLGGNSLNGLQVIARLRKTFQMAIPVVTLFEAPTISALAEILQPREAAEEEQALRREVQLRRRRRQAHQQGTSEPIAIVALTGRFPGASSVEQFWENLRAGQESITRFSEEELLAAGVSPELFGRPEYVRARPILEQVEEFDAAFFGYAPREAQLLDPQHRLFLECCWEALERAGYDAQRYEGLIGVYGGANISTYLHTLLKSPELLQSMRDSVNGYQIAIGMDKDSLATAVSYKLNLRGPSLAVQTFCSTSLVAVHLACQSLRHGECDMALAGGVSVHVPVKEGHLYEEGGQESPDGHCRTFDAQAGGSMFGDGVGVVVLKRLAEAIADGDEVLAVIRGSAINNDGAHKVSYTAPSVVGQAEVVLSALEDAGVSAESISYIEAHGTATRLGDPIEVTSLTKAYRQQTEQVGYCAIGSVKTNVGHLDRAAGISGLIKTVLALKHEELPASLHYTAPNPEIDFEHSPFYVNAHSSAWQRNGERIRRAGINSLGMGGTNAHVIVEEAPEREPSGASRPWQVLLLSARTPEALEQATENLGTYLGAHEELSLADVAYTLQVGRQAMSHRRILVCKDRAGAVASLRGAEGRRLPSVQQEHRDRGVAFLFPGAGAQYARLAVDFYRQEPVFRSWIDQCCTLLKPYLGCDLREVLFTIDTAFLQTEGSDQSPKPDLLTLLENEAYREAAIVAATKRLKQIEIAEPALFTMEYALARLLMQWGIRPQAMSGLGPGEYVVACLAGVFSLKDALRLLAHRAQLLAREAAGVAGCEWTTLTELAQGMTLHPPTIPYLSNMTGTWITEEEATDPTYWARQIGAPVRFAESVGQLLEETTHVLLEVGPGEALGSFICQSPIYAPEQQARVLATLPDTQENAEAGALLLTALGKLWLAGVMPDWQELYAEERRRRVLLPTYPFERKRYWLEPPKASRSSAQPATRKADPAEWFYQETWRSAPLSGAPAPALRYRWLVLLDETGLGSRLAEGLLHEGYAVTCVEAGSSFARLDADHFRVRAEEPDDYARLLETLATEAKLPRRVLHTWAVSVGPQVPGTATLQHAAAGSFYSLVYLARALSGYALSEPLGLYVLSTNAQQVHENDLLQPEHALAQGASMVIAQEPLNVACRCIDLTWEAGAANGWQDKTLLATLLRECTGTASELTVAYRQEERWERTYEARRLPEAPQKPGALREQGVYLITGGLGGIGLALAEDLATRCRARLVLLSRRELPQREAWTAWLAEHGEEDAVSQVLRRLQGIEANGGEVLLVQAEVSDPEQMQAAMQAIQIRFGGLHGVFHAAGVIDDRYFKSVQDIEREDCEVHLRAKGYGTLALAEALEGQTLDFVLLFSSLSTTLGGLGFVAYTATNRYLEAYARWMNRQGRGRWVSVGWDTWLVRANAHGSLGGTIAAFSMEPREGLEVLRRVLESDATCLVQSTGDLFGRLGQWVHADLLRDHHASLQRGAAANGAREAKESVTLSRGEVESRVRAIWQEVLGLEKIGSDEAFFEVGGNSLIALDVIRKLKKSLGRPVPAVALFEAPTIALLVDYLAPQTVVQEEEEASQREQLRSRRRKARRQGEREGIAIIGMSGRFPGATSVEQFWENLHAGRESISFFTPQELEAAGIAQELIGDPRYVAARPVLPVEVVEGFDAGLFDYSPREAELTDPQHRLFLECAWEALERAGYNSQEYEGQIGVFGGTNISTYALSAEEDQLAGVNDYQLLAGNDKDSLTSSVSYKLNLRGPAVAVQTFCSTSLVATHLGCQSLRTGECDLALAGGVSVRVPSIGGHLYEPGGMESPDGHCRTFDARAGGSMFGDGVGVVVLKRLEDALEDGDEVLAVIRGSAINNDGAHKVSYAAPSVIGQAEVVLSALEDAGVSAESISYIEAHGTATELGDPIEVASLTKAYRQQTEQVGYCAIGSVKTNVGHLDRAAGISGLIKTVLALKHEELPASLHYERPNPEIDFEHSPFYVNAQRSAWRRNGAQPRRAGINSLGMGGTNAHVIVEEAPEREPSGASRPWQLLPLSARTPEALEQLRRNLGAYLREHTEVPLADVAYTLQVGRRRLGQRAMLLCRDRQEALGWLEGEESLAVRAEEQTERPVGFLLPGVGEQYVGMTRQLYEREAVFHDEVDRCCALIAPLLGLDLRSLLFKDEGKRSRRNGYELARPKPMGQLGQTEFAQPALFVIDYALARLLMSWGVRPQALLGYSVGEYVAACLSGVFSLEDALRVVVQRARWISDLPSGVMLAVALGEARTIALLEEFGSEQVSLAASVSPMSSVLGGTPEAIARLRARLEAAGIACREVQSSHAFHTSLLAPVQQRLRDLLASLPRRKPAIPYLSNVSGTWITAEQATDPEYWAQQMCSPVRFARGVERLLAEGEYALVEVGPGQALGSFVRQHPDCTREQRGLVMGSLPALYEAQEEQEYLLGMLGKLWLSGVRIDWTAYAAREHRQRVVLPTYPFERQRYWLKSRKPRSAMQTQSPDHNLDAEPPRIADLTDWFYGMLWKQAMQIKGQEKNVQPGATGPWLICTDAHGVGMQVVSHLRRRGEQVISVLPGSGFASLDDETYTVRPDVRADYDALLKDLRLRGCLPEHIVHMWLVTMDQPQGDERDHEETLRRGFYSLLAIAQALGDLELERCEIAVVSNEMQAVLGNERLDPVKATALGPCRVIPQEYGNLHCRSIDVVLPEAGSWHEESLVRQLTGELLVGASDTVVALRGDRRWVQSFEPLALRKEAFTESPWRQGGIYLITGGLGGIALAIADLLARTFQAKLVLLNRTGLPAREQWPDLLKQQPESALAERLRKIQALEAQGSEVLILQADVASEVQMRVACEQIQERFGDLHGVFHLAGLPGVGLTQLKSREQAASVLAPKVQGTLVLERVLREQALDFLVCFSSVTSTTGGGPGQIDYSAANAFLDAFAQSAQQGAWGRVVAIDWGEWQWNAWEAGLSGYGSEAQVYLKEHRQRFGIAFEEGVEALGRILASDLSHVVVSTQDFRILAEQSKNFTAAEVLQKTREQRKALYARPDLASSYVAPGSEFERDIATIWEDLLGVTPVGVNDNFFEMGGNSLLGIDLIARLRKKHNSEALAAHVLYEAPTVGTLARYLEQGQTGEAVIDERHERGKRRREGLKQLMNETRRTRV